jgi:hypothetical protein
VKVLSLILIGMLIGAAGIGAVVASSAEAGVGSSGMELAGSGISLHTQDQTRDQDRDRTEDPDPTQDRDCDVLQDQIRDQVQEQSCDQEGNSTQNQTRMNNVTSLQEQIQERIQAQEREQANLSTDLQPVLNRYAGANAFVYTIQHQSEQLGGIGPQASQIAMQLNNSLQIEAQAQKTLENRHVFMRALFGGDEAAAGVLQQESDRNQQRIQEMNQLIQQCSCDPQVRALLQDQLQQMEQQQVQLRQLAQGELQDKGLLGWIWK